MPNTARARSACACGWSCTGLAYLISPYPHSRSPGDSEPKEVLTGLAVPGSAAAAGSAEAFAGSAEVLAGSAEAFATAGAVAGCAGDAATAATAAPGVALAPSFAS